MFQCLWVKKFRRLKHFRRQKRDQGALARQTYPLRVSCFFSGSFSHRDRFSFSKLILMGRERFKTHEARGVLFPLDYFFIVYRLHIRIPHDFLMKNEWSQSLVEMAHLFGSIGALDCFFIFYRLHFRILRNFLIQNEWLRSKSDLYVGVF